MAAYHSNPEDTAGRTVIVLAGGLAAWVGFRMYVRSALLQELLNSKVIEKMAALNTLSKALGQDLNLPTAQRLAETVVPIWSAVMPQAAIADMLVNGRKSRFWPPEYAEGGDLAQFEPLLLAVGRKMYFAPEGGSNV